MGHELCREDAENILQHNENISSVSMVLGFVEGKRVLGIFRLEVSHDVD